MSLEIGSTLGDYQIIGILGAGGMGRVYKVRNTISDRIEAMKVLLPDLATAPELADRFMREIKVQASLEHPNIAALHTAVRVENQLLMLMEYLEGITLEQRLQKGRLPVGEAVEYIRQALAALDYAHQRGVIHRDIKPANMMVIGSGTLKLMDFGIAKASGDQRLTMTGTTLGSLYYMSPEQIKGAADLDARADLYSVGVSLYELVTGKRPFDGDSQFAIMSAHLEKAPVPPVSIDPSLPESLNDLILMSVAKDPNERFQTAGAFRNALGGFAAAVAAPTATLAAAAPAMAPVPPPVGAPQPAPVAASFAPPSMAPAQPARPRGKRGLWMALGAVGAVLALVAVVQLGPWKSSKAAPEPAAAVPAPQQPAAQQSAEPQPAPPQPSSQPATQPAPSVPEQAAGSTAPAPVPSQPAAKTPVERPSAPRQPARQARTVEQPVSQPAASVPVQQPPVQQRPVQQAPAPEQAAPAAPNRAEMMEFREHMAMLNTRAEGVRTSIQTLKRQQAASGLNLRGDMQEALDMMNVYMRGAHDALQAGDLPAARSYAEKGERQLEKLEKFLNR